MPARRLRILHVINSLDPRQGGTVECVRQIGSSMSNAGHVVEVAVCQDLPDAGWLSQFPLRVHALGPGIGRYAYSPRLRNWLRQNGGNYDAWIINGLWQYQGWGATRIANKLGIPYFVYVHGMLDPWNRSAMPFRYLKKLIYWLAVERSTLEGAEALVFTSTREAELARHYFPTSRWTPLVVGNGVAEPPIPKSDDVAALRKRLQVEDTRKVMLFLGRIHPKKGIEILLRAFASTGASARYDLVIAGDGKENYRRELVALGKALKIDHVVRWPGPLYTNDKWSAFAAAELFVLASHQENFGIAIAEALAMGTPVCTTTAVNIHPLITDSNAGLICHDDEGAFADALARWQNLDSAQVLGYRQNARHCFEQHFRVDKASERLLGAIEKAVLENSALKGASR